MCDKCYTLNFIRNLSHNSSNQRCVASYRKNMPHVTEPLTVEQFYFHTPRNISESSKHVFILLYNGYCVVFSVALHMKVDVILAMGGGAIAQFPLRIVSDDRR